MTLRNSLNIVVALFALFCRTEVFGTETNMQSVILLSAQVPDVERMVQWAKFSPRNSKYVLVEGDSGAYLVFCPEGSIRRIDRKGSSVGWLGSHIVWRNDRGLFEIIEPGTLDTANRLAIGALQLPWPIAQDRELEFDVLLPPGQAKGIVSVISGADVASLTIVARERELMYHLEAGDSKSKVIGPKGNTVFAAQQRIYRTQPSPDGYKLLVYFGDTRWIIVNTLTGNTYNLPSQVEMWRWMPDNNTLLGEVSIPVSQKYEEVGSTNLYVYKLFSNDLVRIEVPKVLQTAILKVHDISDGGHILLEAYRTLPQPKIIGLMILQLVW